MRLFEILDIMNVNDGENKTAHLGVCDEVVAVNIKGTTNGTVTIGVPGDVAHKLIMGDRLKPLLVIVDLDQYEKIKAASNDKPNQ